MYDGASGSIPIGRLTMTTPWKNALTATTKPSAAHRHLSLTSSPLHDQNERGAPPETDERPRHEALDDGVHVIGAVAEREREAGVRKEADQVARVAGVRPHRHLPRQRGAGEERERQAASLVGEERDRQDPDEVLHAEAGRRGEECQEEEQRSR